MPNHSSDEQVQAGQLKSSSQPGCRSGERLVVESNTETLPHSADCGASLQPGDMIAGRYEVLALIGKGGMGEIYKAKQPLLDKVYAIKLLAGNRLDDVTVRRFQTEAKAACDLSHPNLITVHDLGLFDDRPFLVMDLVEGVSLADHLKSKGRLPLSEAVEIFEQVCDGMSYAHDRGVLHRDLKPSNIMLSADIGGLKVKVVDFGIAKRTDSQLSGADHSVTRTGEIFGSPLYMSPEQCLGEPIDFRSDVYSLGCVLFEMLTGHPPFQGLSALETMYLRTQKEAPLLSEKAPFKSFSPALEDVVKNALARDSARRYASMNEFKQALVAAARRSAGSGAGSQPGGKPRMSQALVTLFAVLVAAAASALLVSSLSRNHANSETGSAPQTTSAAAPSLPDTATVTATATASDRERLRRLGLSLDSRRADLSRSEKHPLLTGDDLKCLSLLPLDYLDLTDQKGVDDADLAYVGKIKTLRYLRLRGTGVTENGIASLTDLHNLQVVHLGLCDNISDEQGKVGAALSKISSLQVVDFFQTKIGDSTLKQMSNLKLTRLVVRGTKISDEGLRAISQMPLTDLGLGDNLRIGNGSLHIVADSFPNLRYLNLTAARRITSDGLKYLVKLRYLDDLRVDQDPLIDDRGCKSLAQIQSLRILCLNNDSVGDRGVKELSRLGNLHELEIARTKVTDRAAEYLSSCKSLRQISIGQVHIGDRSVKALSQLPDLRSLGLSHTRITDKSVSILIRFPSLRTVDVEGTPLSRAALEILRQNNIKQGRSNASRSASCTVSPSSISQSLIVSPSLGISALIL